MTSGKEIVLNTIEVCQHVLDKLLSEFSKLGHNNFRISIERLKREVMCVFFFFLVQTSLTVNIHHSEEN